MESMAMESMAMESMGRSDTENLKINMKIYLLCYYPFKKISKSSFIF
jgi:hypothetical protein